MTLAATVSGCGSSGDAPPPPAGAPAPGVTPGNGFSPSTGSSNPNATCAATTAAVEKAKADIIFVIDDSGSMHEETVQIRANMNAFASKIGGSGIDYRVIVMTQKGASGADNGLCVPPPLAAANCGDNAPIFHHVPQSVASTNSLSLILATYDGVSNSPGNEDEESPTAPPWNVHLRPDAWKIFVEVTDDESEMTADAFDAALLAKPPAGMFGTAQARRYIFHSIVGWEPGSPLGSSTKCSTSEGPGTEYQKLSQLTGGIVDSVCKTDYSGVLDQLATGITDRLACELSLPAGATADPSTLVVQLTPSGAGPRPLTQVTDPSKCGSIPDAWYYDDNAKPTKVVLCPSTCQATSTDVGAKLSALVGCKAPPPR